VLALASGAGVVVARQPIYSVMALVANMVCLAVLYLLLSAQFVAVIQVIVYAGAVMVLFLFVVALLSPGREDMQESIPFQRGLAALFALAFLGDLVLVMTRGGAIAGATPAGHAAASTFGTVEPVGEALFSSFLLPFEVTSLLLVAAAVGAIFLSRRSGR
jgi:NADH-quinone oxidoreductase subunit J